MQYFKAIISFFTLLLISQSIKAQVIADIKARPKAIQTFNFRKISANSEYVYELGIEDKGEKSVYYIEKYNVGTLNLEYQKDLKICEDDKLALVHPLFSPPVCFENNNQLIIFYNSYNESEKSVKINVKIMNQNGDVNPKFISLISSKDIEIQLDGFYWNLINYTKPAISYSRSDDKKSIIIEIDCPKLKKIYVYKVTDLIAGKTEHKEFDIKLLTETEKIVINKCFATKDILYFSYTKKTSQKMTDFGFAVFDNKANTFQLKNLGLTVNELFSLDYMKIGENKIFISGFLRYPINAAKASNIENQKVKPFNVQFNITELVFENKNEYDFTPNIAKQISSVKSPYGFIEKTHSADQYIENEGLLESTDYYYSITQLLFGKEPTSTILIPQIGGPGMPGGGVTTICRDILITQFDKSGKLINQYLLPRYSGFNTVAGSRSGVLYGFANKQRNFCYGLKGNDLHVIYLDNSKNEYGPVETYDPANVVKGGVGNSSLIDMKIKNNKVEKEILVTEKDRKVYFYSNQNMMAGNDILLDVEDGKKNSQLGKILIN